MIKVQGYTRDFFVVEAVKIVKDFSSIAWVRGANEIEGEIVSSVLA
jgi:hypothetical protein